MTEYIIASSTGIKMSMYRFSDMIEAIKEAAKMTKHYKGTGITFHIESI